MTVLIGGGGHGILKEGGLVIIVSELTCLFFSLIFLQQK
jgi:hypothetical protein